MKNSSIERRNSGVLLEERYGKTLDDILAIVKYAIGRLRRLWTITDTEAQDLEQDGYFAAISASQTYDPSKGAAWSTWVLRRVDGQLRTSLQLLRRGGITHTAERLRQVVTETRLNHDRDHEADEEPDLEITAIAASATDEEADTAARVEQIMGCLSARSRQVLTLYYGLDGSPAISTEQLGERLGHSKKHAFTLLQRAQREAKACVGVRNQAHS